jgi:hypothetical protein
VSSERRDERRPVDADHDRGTQALDVGRDERVRVDTLEQAADDPHDPAEGAQRRLGGVRVGGLRVVDPADAAGHRHRLDAVRVEAEVAERVVDHPDRDPVGPRERGRREDVLHDVRSGEPVGFELPDRDDLERSGAALVEEGTIAEDPLDHAEVARARDVEPEADGARALLDLGVLDHVHRRLVGAVVDAGDLGVRVHGGLRRRYASGEPCQSRWSSATFSTTLAHGCSAPGPVVGRWCSW